MIYPHRGSSINDIHAVLFHLTKLNTILKLEGTNGAWEILCNISIFEPAVQLIWPPKAVLVCDLPITNAKLL
jgi:hypothetical protein